jgi:hypothetical protein
MHSAQHARFFTINRQSIRFQAISLSFKTEIHFRAPTNPIKSQASKMNLATHVISFVDTFVCDAIKYFVKCNKNFA